MKGMKKKKVKHHTQSHVSDESEFHNDSANIPYLSKPLNGTAKKSKHMKRKRKSDDDSLVLLSTAANKKIGPKVKRKKMQETVQNESPFHYSDYGENETEESSAAENGNSDSFPSFNLSSDICDPLESDEESLIEESKNLSENFGEKIESTQYLLYDNDSNESDKFFMEKKKQLVDELKSSPETNIRKMDKNVKITSLASKNLMVVLLNHPATLTLYKYVSVEVLSGSISICGHEINSKSAPIRVFSSERSGFIGIKTESFEQVWMKKTFYNLSLKLQRITGNKKIAHNILNKFGNSTVVVVVAECIFPPNLQFLELYFPLELQFKMFRKKRINCYIPKEFGTGLVFGPDAENLADEIISAIRRSKLNGTSGPVILIYGPKNAGKSSLLQFLVNKALSMFPSVFYLDADPGQTEFTPPAVVSLTKVSKPIIGPSFCHQKKPLSMIFTGATSAGESPYMYLKSIHKLVSMFKTNYYTETLFVNTMGWLKGIGLKCLQEIVKTVQPAILGEIVIEEFRSTFDYKSYITGKAKYFPISSPVSDSIPGLAPQEIRNLSLLSYFGKCQAPHLRPTYINEFKPFCVSWDKIPIYVFGRKVPPFRIVEAINASVVALCYVPEKDVLVSEISHFPMTLQDEPLNECFGFGIVRAIDEANHLLYIVTPMELNEMNQVNAIIKGNVQLPPSVLLNQQILDVPLPFTNDISDSNADSAKYLGKKIHKRYRHTSLPHTL